MTFVSPISTSTDPSGNLRKFLLILISLILSFGLPLFLILSCPFRKVALHALVDFCDTLTSPPGRTPVLPRCRACSRRAGDRGGDASPRAAKGAVMAAASRPTRRQTVPGSRRSRGTGLRPSSHPTLPPSHGSSRPEGLHRNKDAPLAAAVDPVYPIHVLLHCRVALDNGNAVALRFEILREERPCLLPPLSPIR